MIRFEGRIAFHRYSECIVVFANDGKRIIKKYNMTINRLATVTY
jgi:hypothetical protein